MEKLPIDIVQKKLEQIGDWKIVEEKWLVKKYRFSTYMEGIQFVNQVAELSERENHHPFINIEYTLITLKLTSWKARGITALDLTLIEEYDRIFGSLTTP